MPRSPTKSASTSSTRVRISFRSSCIFSAPYTVPGGPALLAQLKADGELMANANAKQGIEEMELLFSYLHSYKVLDKVRNVSH